MGFREKVINEIYEFNVIRRHWFKSFEIVTELVCKAYEMSEISQKFKTNQFNQGKRELINTDN